MKRLGLLFILISMIACNNNVGNTAYYVYDPEYELKKSEGSTMIFYKKSIPVYTSRGDSMTFQISNIGYFLLHFKEDSSGNQRDTSFLKPITFLSSINYYNSEWLKNEENLKEFWPEYLYESGGMEDTLEIYLIHPIPGTDSIKLEQVHRWYKPNREG
ncbi:hypothetical protein [uncultured Draconibacterium sp.]|uniref:hypothetical protein n=1 Tax=uncultured Draconibacterium sp. TaxID=1573823 RepID=UPI002AA7A72B|nr:hypothetical protein [uncultured Draconibacterium sp.]